MPAYVIADIDPHDQQQMQAYSAAVGPTIVKYGGKVLGVTAQADVLEGDWQPKRLVLIEFESMERAKEWYDSEDYRELKAMRQRASSGAIVALPGLQG